MEKQGRRVLKLEQNFVAGKIAQGKTLKKQLTPWKVLHLCKLSNYIIPCFLPAPAATREETLLTAAQDLHRGKPGFSEELEVPG